MRALVIASLVVMTMSSGCMFHKVHRGAYVASLLSAGVTTVVANSAAEAGHEKTALITAGVGTLLTGYLLLVALGAFDDPPRAPAPSDFAASPGRALPPLELD